MPLSNVGSSPHYRWMLFVDGENFTIRGQKMAEIFQIKLAEGTLWCPDVFLWMKNTPASLFLTTSELSASGGYLPINSHLPASRCYYYTGVKGDDDKLKAVRNSLREIGFDPQVFKKDKPNQPTKAVDIALATEILSLNHQNAFDIACIIAGDRDYVPLVRAVKRTGKRVYVSFFNGYPEAGLSDELRLEADLFLDLTGLFREKAVKQK